jgi:polyhydroxyalkanoate synthesis regulator phasin
MAAVSAVVEDQGHMSSDEAHRYMADLERSGRLRH